MHVGFPSALAAFALSARPAVALILRGPRVADIYGLDAPGKPLDEQHQRDQTVELLRFVTAYGTGIETLVDLTPYSPLLDAGRASDEGLTVYAFIDTWVNNETGSDAMYMNNITEQCTPIVRSYGNGWALSAELVFWPRSTLPGPPADAGQRETKRSMPARPKRSVTLASGFYGSNYDFGRIRVHAGKMTTNASEVLLENAVDFRGSAHAEVYECRQGSAEIEYAARIGYLVQQVEFMTRRDGNTSAAEKLLNDTFKSLAYGEFVALGEVKHNSNGRHGNRSLRVEYSAEHAQPEVGMPVYFHPGDVFTDQEMHKGLWWNMSYPFEPIGNVTAINNGTLDLLLQHSCLPTSNTRFGSVIPRLIMPRSSKALPALRAQLDEVGRVGNAAALQPAPVDKVAAAGIDQVKLLLPHRVKEEPQNNGEGATSRAPDEYDAKDGAENNANSDNPASLGQQEVFRLALQPPRLLGRVSLNDESAAPSFNSTILLQVSTMAPDAAAPTGDQAATEQPTVCVVEQRRQGRLFERHFQLEDLETDDVVVLQLTVTGHGWSATTEQCGEYCHALYQLRFNGQLVHNVSQFRNDCKENPVGVNTTQIGTWWESRNGWCPGSVEPGIFVDVSKWLHKGQNHLVVDVLVWSQATSTYELYTDLGGFAFEDAASLAVGLNLFVYGADAVAAARARERPGTPAEAAIKDGVGGRGELDPQGPPVTDEAVVQLAQLGSRVSAQSHNRAEIETREPGHRPIEQPSVARSHALHTGSSQQAALWRSRAQAFAQLGSGATHIHSQAQARPQQPWYFLNSSVPEQVKASEIEDQRAVRVPVLVGELIQGARRTVYARLEPSQLPEDWGSVAVHFTLAKPPGDLAFDHWDRVGSLGLKLGASSVPDGISLHEEPPLIERTRWSVTKQ